MICKMCKERGKTWEGDNPTCFLFRWKDNWNCATLNAIRDICYEGSPLPDGVRYTYVDDMKYATIRINSDDEYIGLCLYVEWYKNRGGTDEMWLLGNGEPQRPNEKQLLMIIDQYGRSINANRRQAGGNV